MDEMPVVKGLLVCEKVITDSNTRNTSVINRFTTLRLSEFPTTPRRVSVFAALSNANGRMPLELVLEPHAEGDSIYRFAAVVVFPNPLQEIRFILNIPAHSFPHPGGYDVTLYAGDEPLKTTTIRVLPPDRGIV
jgi:hypothetical protein